MSSLKFIFLKIEGLKFNNDEKKVGKSISIVHRKFIIDSIDSKKFGLLNILVS
jgi:hypothetical protein